MAIARHPQTPRRKANRYPRRFPCRTTTCRIEDRESGRRRKLQHLTKQRTAGTPIGGSRTRTCDSEAERAGGLGDWMADAKSGQREVAELA